MEGVGVGIGSENGDALALKCVGDVCAGILVSCCPLAIDQLIGCLTLVTTRFARFAHAVDNGRIDVLEEHGDSG